MEQVEITCENTGTAKKYDIGTSLLEVAIDQKIQLRQPILTVMVDNQIKSLIYKVYNPKTVRFIDISHPDGMRIYQRSLIFLLQKAVRDVLPNHQLRVKHSIANGLYCEIANGKDPLTPTNVDDVLERMRDMVKQNIPFTRKKTPTAEAIEIFRKENHEEKALLLKTRSRFYTSVYYLDGYPDHFYGPLVPSTGFLTKFGLVRYNSGVLLMFPKPDNMDELQDFVEQEKLFDIFKEHKEWTKILGVNGLGSLNSVVQEGYTAQLIKVAEALQEKKYALIADQIYDKHEMIKLVLIAGPSSSGKTTTSKRLAIQLKVAKLNPVVIELDNYFVNREDTPRDENGDYDFENLHALDVNFFNQQLKALLSGEEIEIPKFDFFDGKRYFDGTMLKLGENDILVVEGIHALNPELTQLVPDKYKFRIYASALTSISIDENNRIPTTDNRLIRRIVRDSWSRGYTALDTIRRWQSVRKGENKNIFPYQENADVMFNSALLFELSVLKSYAEPLLRKIPPIEPEYAEATRLLKFLGYFEAISKEDEQSIPPTSVLREFIGGSSFKY